MLRATRHAAGGGQSPWRRADLRSSASAAGVRRGFASFGTVTLDAWALFRNSELTGTPQRLESWLCDRLTYYL